MNEAFMRDGAPWKEAAAAHRRTVRRYTLWAAPFCILGAAYKIGRGDDTAGMYLEGAAAGAVLAFLVYFGLPRVMSFERSQKSQIDAMRLMDYSAHVGTVSIIVDEQVVRIQWPNRQLALSWEAVSPSESGEFVLLETVGQDTVIIPRRAFASQAAAAEFVSHAQRWWQAGQRPHAERLERYLADLDLACPACKYNLKGTRGEACPECGYALRLESLMSPGASPG